MIVLSLNCRGLASLPKKLAVRRLVEEKALDILFLQESMGRVDIIAAKLETMLKGWSFISVDAFGKLSGLLIGWKINFQTAWVVVYGLSVTLFSIELKVALCFVNVYGPCVDRDFFWNILFDLDCLTCSKLICGGDLNFTIGFSEIWGNQVRADTLSDFFR